MIPSLLAGLAAAAALSLVLAFTTGLLQTAATAVLLVGYGVGCWVAFVGAARPGEHEPPEEAAPDPRPQRLVRLERLIAEAADSAAVEHQRLRPLLASITAERLAAVHGFRMDEEPARAAALLGDQAWELLRPDRPPPRDRRAPGRGVSGLARIVAAIEGVVRT